MRRAQRLTWRDTDRPTGRKNGGQEHSRRSTRRFRLLARPDHAGLLFRAEPQPFIEARHARAQPEQLDLLKGGMVENPSDNFAAYSAPLIVPIDDHVPDRGPVHVVCQHAAEGHEARAVPGGDDDIGVGQHRAGLFKVSMLCPGSLAIKMKQLCGVEIGAIGEGDRLFVGIESGRHLILN
ncbi:MAG: hypothetical protein K0S58_457 [Nitrospira sp.]|nr:hypothetical protein [Nitrospira sp.]